MWPLRGALRRVATRQGLIYGLLTVVVLAALALAWVGLRYAQELARGGEQLMIETNRELADGLRKRIEQIIVDSDRTVFDLIDVRNLQQFPRRWSDVVRLSPTVESAMVLDQDLQIVPDGFVSKKRSKPEADAFRERFAREMVKRLDLANLDEDAIRHLHEEFGGRYYLLAYTRRWYGGTPYTIVLEADLAYLVGEVFPDSFAGVDARRLYQITDEHDRPVFGYPLSGVAGRYEVAVPFDRTLYRWRLRMAPRDASSLQAKARWRSGGMVGLILLSATTVTVGLGVLGFAIRAERRAAQLKSDFIANVSHELKTPLSLIRMFGEMLSTGRTRNAESAREYASIITRESERLTHLIDNVLDFARIERGKEAYQFEPRSLRKVVEHGLELAGYRLEQAGMTVHLQAATDLPDAIIDESAMTLAFLNLIDNAIKYAASGKDLHVSLESAGGRQVLTVRDQGPGFDPELAVRVFERFYRTPEARREGVRGSGIGLALVKHIAQAHGGGVEVKVERGTGAAFSVWVPEKQTS